MKISHVQCTPYLLQLNQPFHSAKNLYHKKEGYIIKLTTNIGDGYGDVSPLDGFSNENLQEIYWGFQAFLESIDFTIDYKMDELLNIIQIYCQELPSLHFALDTAVYHLESLNNNVSLSKLLNPKCTNNVSLSNLYLDNTQINKINSQNIKYKLGVNSLKKDINALNTILKFNNSIKFRFDANQAYTLKEFKAVYKELSHLNIDYFEEPIKSPTIKKLKDLQNQSNITIAIDDSIYNGENYELWFKEKLVHVAVIKPSILGGFKKFFKLNKLCQKYNIKLILSSSLESSIGNMATIHLAAAIDNNLEHGLNIHNFYKDFMHTPIYSNKESSVNLKNIGLGLHRWL